MSATYECCGRERKWSHDNHAEDCPARPPTPEEERHGRLVAVARRRKRLARSRMRQVPGAPILETTECPHGLGLDCPYCPDLADERRRG